MKRYYCDLCHNQAGGKYETPDAGNGYPLVETQYSVLHKAAIGDLTYSKVKISYVCYDCSIKIGEFVKTITKEDSNQWS